MVLKRNSKKILDIIAGQTERNATQAYKQVHPNADTATAVVNASQLLAKPEAQIYLQEHVSHATETVVELMDSEKDDIRLRSAQDVLNRQYGTPTQTVKQTTSGVTLVIDLTSALATAELNPNQPINN